MQEKEQEKQCYELFDEIKPRTLPKQEWRQKEAPQHPTIELAVGNQTAASGGQTAASMVLGSQTMTSGSQTARAQKGHNPASTMSGQPGGQTASLDGQTASCCSLTVRPPEIVGLTTNSCGAGPSDGTDRDSTPVGMEDTDDNLLDYEPSPTRDGMDVNVIYLLSTDYYLLEEEEVSQLALGP
jgi:hypothetical protein